MRIQISLTPAIVLRPPDEVKPREHCSIHRGVKDGGNVEGLCLSTKAERPIGNIPPRLAVALEIQFRCRIEEIMETNVRVKRTNPGLAAIAKNIDGPVTAAAQMRAVVLRSAHQGAGWVARIVREALILQRRQPIVHRSDRGWDRREPMLAIS